LFHTFTRAIDKLLFEADIEAGTVGFLLSRENYNGRQLQCESKKSPRRYLIFFHFFTDG